MFLTTSRETVGHFDQNGRDVRGTSLQCFLQLAGGREVPISTTAIIVRERAKRDKQRVSGGVYSVRLSDRWAALCLRLRRTGPLQVILRLA